MSLREHEIEQILGFAGVTMEHAPTYPQINAAIRYAYEWGHTDGSNQPKMIPVGSISHFHLEKTDEPWCKEVLLYSPKNSGDNPERRVMLYTTGESPSFEVYVIRGIAKDGVESKLFAFSTRELAHLWLEYQSNVESLEHLKRTCFAYSELGFMACSATFAKNTAGRDGFGAVVFNDLKELTA